MTRCQLMKFELTCSFCLTSMHLSLAVALAKSLMRCQSSCLILPVNMEIIK